MAQKMKAPRMQSKAKTQGNQSVTFVGALALTGPGNYKHPKGGGEIEHIVHKK